MRRNSRTRLRRRRRYRTRRLRGGSTVQPTTHIFYCEFHLGDNILNLKFFFNIASVLKERGIKIIYLYNPNYVKNPDELKRYVDPETLTLDVLTTPPAGAIKLWMGEPIDGVAHFNFDEFYIKFYTMILQKLGLADLGIDTSLYQKEPYLEEVYGKLNDTFKDLDVLIINADPQSYQTIFNKELFHKMCIMLWEKKYKIATTSPIPENESIPCTMKANLLLQDIGAISTHAKFIIAVHSGPLTPCFTAATKQNVKKWILFVDNGVVNSQIPSVIIRSGYNHDAIEEHLKG
jgi:hypothetical protein